MVKLILTDQAKSLIPKFNFEIEQFVLGNGGTNYLGEPLPANPAFTSLPQKRFGPKFLENKGQNNFLASLDTEEGNLSKNYRTIYSTIGIYANFYSEGTPKFSILFALGNFYSTYKDIDKRLEFEITFNENFTVNWAKCTSYTVLKPDPDVITFLDTIAKNMKNIAEPDFSDIIIPESKKISLPEKERPIRKLRWKDDE